MFINKTNYISIFAVLSFFIVWQLISSYAIVSPAFISSPFDVFNRFIELINDGSLLDNLKFSMMNLIIGFSLSIILGITLGFLFYSSDLLYSLFKPFLFSFNSMPLISILPLILLWFGFADRAKILTVIIFCAPTIIINSYYGCKNIKKELLIVSKAFKLSRLKFTWSILFFGALPYIMVGIRLSIGRAMIGLILSEMFGYGKGIGYLLFLYSTSSDTTGLFLLTFIILVINFVLISMINTIKSIIFKKYNYEV